MGINALLIKEGEYPQVERQRSMAKSAAIVGCPERGTEEDYGAAGLCG